jgi:predicted metal-binding transcription factor (methanogenesis marker protein 9)
LTCSQSQFLDEQPFAKSKIGAKTAHGMLKFRCGITVPPPCLALLYQEYISLNKEVYLSLKKKFNLQELENLTRRK